MVKNAPAGTTQEGIVKALHAKGYTIQGVDGSGDVGQFFLGAAKGLGSTVASIGELGAQIFLNPITKIFNPKGKTTKFGDTEKALENVGVKDALTPTNTAQKVGFAGEQIAELAIPSGWLGRGVKGGAELAKIGTVTKAEKWLSKLPAAERLATRIAESPAARKIAQVAGKAATKVVESPLIKNTIKDVAITGAQTDFNPASMTAAAVIGPGLAAVGKIAKTPLTWAAKRLYQSALKPSTTLAKNEVDKIINTALEHRLFVTNGGVEKLGSKIDMFEDQLGAVIKQATEAGKKISLKGMQSYVDEAKKLFSDQIDVKFAKNAIKELDDLVADFAKEHGDEIAPDLAQKIKVTTMRAVRKYYGELSGANIEGQKQGARFLKDQIIAITKGGADEVNKRLAGLYQLDEQLTRAANRSGNWNILGMGTKAGAVIGAGAAAVTGDLKAGAVAAAGIAADLLDRAGIKSGVAIGANELGKLTEKIATGGRIPALVLITKIIEQLTNEEAEQQ